MEKISLEDRGIYDVSSARGSQIYLIVGSEKAAVVDAGMAYSAEEQWKISGKFWGTGHWT